MLLCFQFFIPVSFHSSLKFSLQVNMVNKTASKSNVDPPSLSKRGRLYVGNLPFGFYHEALKEYFSQFGKVTKVRVERSKRTGGFKGYAFVEFENTEVAQIAADATNNYIIDKKILKARCITPEDQHVKRLRGRKTFETFKTPTSVQNTNLVAAVGQSKKRLMKKREMYLNLHEKLSEFGIELDEIPINLASLDERIAETKDRNKRIQKLKEENKAKKTLQVKIQKHRKLKKQKSEKHEKKSEKSVEKTEENEDEDPEIESEDDVYKPKNVIDTFEKALDALKGVDNKTEKETEGTEKVEKGQDGLWNVGNEVQNLEVSEAVGNSSDENKDEEVKTKTLKRKRNDLKTVAVSKFKSPVSKKTAEKREPVKRKVEKVAREISDDSPSEILKKRPSKESLASKNGQITKKKVTKLVKERDEKESTRKHEEKAVKESDDNEKPVLKKKKFDKKEVMQSFRHKVKNIQFKYMS